METILRRLIVSPRPFTEKQIADRERMATFLTIPGVVVVKNEYRHVPGILNQLRLETDKDIEEASLREALLEPGYQNIHLTLTMREWEQLGIRGTLRGQSREVETQGITYSRPADNLRKYSKTIRDIFTDETIVEWHELDHMIRALTKTDPTSTHYHFYGYAGQYKYVSKSEQDKIKPRRYVRTPDPLEAWRALPWHKLESKEELYKLDLIKDALVKIVGLYKLLLAKQAKLVKPLRTWGQNISQKYGEYNPTLYPLTQHHIGVDHPVPKGTPVYAPAAGEVVQSGYTKTLGYYVQYKYREDRYLVALHLQAAPEVREYQAGEQLATVGDTGFILGVHSHIEIWTQYVDRTSLPADLGKTWRTITRNPVPEF